MSLNVWLYEKVWGRWGHDSHTVHVISVVEKSMLRGLRREQTRVYEEWRKDGTLCVCVCV
jgi:hypothetical protein